MTRVRFDDLILELANLGCETWDDLTAKSRLQLVRAYFEEYPEWGDCLYERMEHVFDAFEHHDPADFGLAIAQKMSGYVRPYIEKQLAYQVMCRREREEMSA